eukprot:2608446-Prymnesium_polylepis.1
MTSTQRCGGAARCAAVRERTAGLRLVFELRSEGARRGASAAVRGVAVGVGSECRGWRQRAPTPAATGAALAPPQRPHLSGWTRCYAPNSCSSTAVAR